jgi:RND superfamily putative drug exporter
MFDLLASVVIRRGWLVVLGWIALAITLRAIAPPWESVSRDDDVRFFPPGYPSVVGQDLLERGFPKDASGAQFILVAERPEGPLTTADLAHVDRMADAIKRIQNLEVGKVVEELEALGETEIAGDVYRLKLAGTGLGIKQVVDHRALVIGPRLVGTNAGGGQAALTVVTLSGTYLARQTRVAVNAVLRILKTEPRPPTGLVQAVTGSAAVGRDVNVASNSSIDATTKATILLVVVILLVVYRSPLLALLPLLSIGLSVRTSLWGIAALTRIPGLDFQVINITNVFVIVVLFGAGTDYCLFLIARYREELARGRNGPDALREAIVQVGGALVASAGTVICGLGMLWFSSFAKIQYTGPAIALSLAIGLLAALTLAPALLYWLRGAVFWPFRPPHHELGHDRDQEALEQLPMHGAWARIADFVVCYPGRILLVSLLALIPFAVIGARTTPNYSQLADLGHDQPSVIGSRLVQKYFAVGELGPSSVLLAHPGLNFRSEDGRAAIEALSISLAALPHVVEVRSASRPLGKPEKTDEHLSFRDKILRRGYRIAADPRYISTQSTKAADNDHITKIDLVLKYDPFAETSLHALDDVRKVVKAESEPGHPLAGMSATGLTGATALIYDLKDVTTRDQQRMYILVTLGVYTILVILLRRPGICLYLIFTVILGYLASLGMTELVFKWMHVGPEPWVGLDWKVGFFLFVILVAVGEDYNILLMARVLEEERKHGTIEGTRQAMSHTGGIISSCGLIMAGTFGSMLTGSLTTLRELGFALGLGVLLDTFIVRPILVPAFVVLMHNLKHGKDPVPGPSPIEPAFVAGTIDAPPGLTDSVHEVSAPYVDVVLSRDDERWWKPGWR